MRFIWKFLLVALLVFSTLFVIMLWIESLFNSLRYASLWLVLFVSVVLMVDVKPKVFSCLFVIGVLCSYVKREKATGVMDRCLKCRFYRQFMQEMAEEDEKVMDEIDRMRRFEPYE